MATLYVSYYGTVESGCGSNPVASETVTTSGTSAQSGANANWGVVAMLYSSAAHYFTVGANPTAAAGNSCYLPANTALWVAIGPEEKIAAITV